MSASTAAERVILRDGDWELEQLLDGLGDDDDGTRRRPVIAETTIRYLVCGSKTSTRPRISRRTMS
ncbi:hypothetical protein UK99_15825 [Frankia casuarinae]|uniref:hypothetical protein n=1 Tax=Frankia casuarinae (strain DSM 45818 / CECT 9043 / HFP020203 / CcI3) TaxID=106370 RepID=UPI000A11DBC7|nr:hypothetical protein [Frankia casuarinae]ORT94574.1 hypothetical protein UK99_15825 [Frankia casuarinae]